MDRASTVRFRTHLVTKRTAQHTLKDAKKIRRLPSVDEIEKLRALPPGHMVLV